MLTKLKKEYFFMAEELAINTSVEETKENPVENTENEKLYTAAEIQSLIDRRVTQAVKTVQTKYEKKLSLEKLDDNERAKAEKDNRIAELEEQLALFQIEKNKSELKSVLSARGLSAEFADLVAITDDIEASQATIDRLDKLFKAAVKQEVEKRLAGNAPKANGASAATELTREELLRKPLAEQQKLMETNPELYNKLFN